MFCAKCGTEIPEGAGFCPACGTKIAVGEEIFDSDKGYNADSIKEGGQDVKANATSTVTEVSSAIKSVVHDKNVKGFFARKRFRNTKILLVFVLIAIVLVAIFNRQPNNKGFKEAEKQAFEGTGWLEDVEKPKSSKIELVGYNKDKELYTLLISVEAKTTYGSNGTLYFLGGVSKEGEVTYLKAAKSIIPTDKKECKDFVSMMKDMFKEQGLKIK